MLLKSREDIVNPAPSPTLVGVKPLWSQVEKVHREPTGEFPLISLVRNFCRVLRVSIFSFWVILLGEPTSKR